MSYNILKAKVDQFFAAKNIAVFGVSQKEVNAPANANFKKLEQAGFHAIPINPNYTEFKEQTSYASVAEVPGGVEAALIFTHPKVTAEVVQQCIDSGVQSIWIHHGMGPGSQSREASQILQDHPEVNFIDGACPMMFIPGADWFHRGYKNILKWTGGLPA